MESHEASPLIESVSPNAKQERLLKKLPELTAEQQEELKQICAYIESQWQTWTEDPKIVDVYSFLRFDVGARSFITVHPNVPEVCIFLDGHTKVLGKGYFKSVSKAISYERECEVAVATPHELNLHGEILHVSDLEGESSAWKTEDLSSWTTFSSLTTLSGEDDFTEMDSFSFSDEEEAAMLEAVQGCSGVIKLHFIAYHQVEEAKKPLPIIVTKYYNGGDIYNFYQNGMQGSLEEILLVCHDILMGLTEIHERGITHNDLHWGNILLERDRQSDKISAAVISDFGLARKLNRKVVHYNNDTDNLYGIVYKFLTYAKYAKPILDYVSKASAFQVPASKVYKAYVNLLSTVVDAETADRIQANSTKNRSLKVKYDNIIKWVECRP